MLHTDDEKLVGNVFSKEAVGRPTEGEFNPVKVMSPVSPVVAES